MSGASIEAAVHQLTVDRPAASDTMSFQLTVTELVDLLAPVVAVLAKASADAWGAGAQGKLSERDQGEGSGFGNDLTVVVHVLGAQVLAAGISQRCAIARTRTSAAAPSAGPVAWAVPLAEASRILAVARRWQRAQPHQVVRIDERCGSVEIAGPVGQVLLVARRPRARAAMAHVAAERMRRALADLDAAAREPASADCLGPALRIMQRRNGRGRAVYGDGVLGLVVERGSR